MKKTAVAGQKSFYHWLLTVYTYAIPVHFDRPQNQGLPGQKWFLERIKKYAGIIKIFSNRAACIFKTNYPQYIGWGADSFFKNSWNFGTGSVNTTCALKAKWWQPHLPSILNSAVKQTSFFNEEAGEDFYSPQWWRILVAEALLNAEEAIAVVWYNRYNVTYTGNTRLIDKNICFTWEKLERQV